MKRILPGQINGKPFVSIWQVNIAATALVKTRHFSKAGKKLMPAPRNYWQELLTQLCGGIKILAKKRAKKDCAMG